MLLVATCIVATAACSGVPSDGAEERREIAQRVEDVEGLRPVEPFTVLTKTAADDPRRFEEARLIVEAWQAAGIPAELEAVDSAEVSERGFANKEFDTYLIAYDPTLERLDPDDFLSRFWSGTAESDGSNLSGYRNDEYDELYLGQLRAGTDEERMDFVREAERLLSEEQPAAPYLRQTIGSAYNSGDWTGAVSALGNPVYHIWNSLQMRPTGDRRTLVVGVIAETQTLNPVTATTSEAAITLSHIYDSLVRIGPEGEPVDWAASDVQVEGSTVEVTLRDGMTFHDGRPVTGEDVAFTIDYLLENEAPLYAAKLDGVTSTSVEGDTVTIKLDSPSASFVPTALATVPILPKHVWEGVDPADFANDQPVGSGPFAFESRKLGASLELQAFEDHFQPPEADGIIWATFGSIDAEIGALQQGEIDILGDFLSVSQLDALKDADRVTVQEETSHGWNGVHFNMRREPFNDLHFRRALAALIPVDDIREIVLRGGGEPTSTVLAEQLPWHDTELEDLSRELEAATQEMEEAGYVIGSDGTLYYPPEGEDNRALQPLP